MKTTMLTLLLSYSLSIIAKTANQAPANQYKNLDTVISELKLAPEKTIIGPFLLSIKSITTNGHKTNLNTSENPDDAKNIVIEMPAFIKTHYVKKYKTDISTLFLNQNLVVKGQIKLVEVKQAENQAITKKIPTLKLIFENQLAHYD